jgi:hypothetical protein
MMDNLESPVQFDIYIAQSAISNCRISLISINIRIVYNKHYTTQSTSVRILQYHYIGLLVFASLK